MNTLVVVFSLKGIFLCCAALISKNVLSHLIFISIQVIGDVTSLFIAEGKKILLKQTDVKTYFLI